MQWYEWLNTYTTANTLIAVSGCLVVAVCWTVVRIYLAILKPSQQESVERSPQPTTTRS
jgi:hypothetical protein